MLISVYEARREEACSGLHGAWNFARRNLARHARRRLLVYLLLLLIYTYNPVPAVGI